MDNTLFYNSFRFLVYSYKSAKHTDNSDGIKCHFIGRLRRGNGLILTENGGELRLCKGDIFYLPLGLRYNSYWYPDGADDHTVEWESYGFLIYPCESDDPYGAQIIYPDELALSILDGITANMNVSVSTVGMFYSFLGRVFPSMDKTSPDPRKKLFLRAEEYIREHPDFRVPMLAKHCGISESGLYSLFKSYGNTTPIDVKNKIQIERAVALLRTTDASVEEICTSVGFQSTAYFRRLIKEQTSKTPSQIRKEWEMLNYL